MVDEATKRIRAMFSDPEPRRKYEETIRDIAESSRKPWNELASCILDRHGKDLSKSELGFVQTMAGSKKPPAKRNLDRLAEIAMRFGIRVD
jgi:hypothetical protein